MNFQSLLAFSTFKRLHEFCVAARIDAVKQKDITAVMKEVVAIDTDTETGKLANLISIHPKI